MLRYAPRNRYYIGLYLALPLWNAISQYAAKHVISRAKLVRNILSLVNWTDRNKFQIVLSLNKGLIQDKERLRAALLESVELIMESVDK